MEENEMLEQTNETENVDTQTTEENGEGIELTDTTEEVGENEETTETDETEEVKTFTQEEVDEIVKKRLARKDREYQKELSKYKDVENVLNAGLGTHSIEEAGTSLRDYYKEQGVDLPAPVKPGLSDRELQLLGNGDAEEILELGLQEAEKEANRLAQLGRENWSAREEAEFNKLASKLDYEKKKTELKSIGVSADILDSKEFNDFVKKFNYRTDIKDIYNLYSKAESKKQFTKLGSMKNTVPEKVEKEYTSDEIDALTLEDLDDDAVWNAVRKAMTGKK